MTAQHTPAPWYALAEGITDAAIGYRAIIDADGYTVCNPSPMGEANARLIAAAPDLLEVLRDVREAWLAGRMGDVEGILTGDVCINAISKATGNAQ